MMLTKLKAQACNQARYKTSLLQHDNSKSHTSLKTAEHVTNLGWTVDPSHILDLALSDFHLFKPMKDGLHGQHFPSNDTLIAPVKQWVISDGGDFYECGIQALVHC